MTSTHPAVDWVLDRVQSYWAGEYGAGLYGAGLYGGGPPLRLVDRDNSQTYTDGESIDMSEPIHERKSDLEAANYVSASFASRGGSLVGTEPMMDSEVVVSVRVEGLHHSEWGHIDPSGENGVPFDQLVAVVRNAVWSGVQYPDAGPSDVSYRHLSIGNEDPQSVGWKDFYRHSLDVTLTGYEEINQ